MEHIATFYSHFGAIRYKKDCEARGLSAKMSPVPRDLSSSCGTCVRAVGESVDLLAIKSEEMELLVRVEADGYHELYRAEES